jgi:hypothetical protein
MRGSMPKNSRVCIRRSARYLSAHRNGINRRAGR